MAAVEAFQRCLLSGVSAASSDEQPSTSGQRSHSLHCVSLGASKQRRYQRQVLGKAASMSHKFSHVQAAMELTGGSLGFQTGPESRRKSTSLHAAAVEQAPLESISMSLAEMSITQARQQEERGATDLHHDLQTAEWHVGELGALLRQGGAEGEGQRAGKGASAVGGSGVAVLELEYCAMVARLAGAPGTAVAKLKALNRLQILEELKEQVRLMTWEYGLSEEFILRLLTQRGLGAYLEGLGMRLTTPAASVEEVRRLHVLETYMEFGLLDPPSLLQEEVGPEGVFSILLGLGLSSKAARALVEATSAARLAGVAPRLGALAEGLWRQLPAGGLRESLAMVQFLDGLGVATETMPEIMQHAQGGLDEIKRQVGVLQELGLRDLEVGHLMSRAPWLFRWPANGWLDSLAYLQSLELNNADIRFLIQKNPRLLLGSNAPAMAA